MYRETLKITELSVSTASCRIEIKTQYAHFKYFWLQNQSLANRSESHSSFNTRKSWSRTGSLSTFLRQGEGDRGGGGGSGSRDQSY